MRSRGKHVRKVHRRRWPAIALAMMLAGMLVPAGGALAAPGGPVVMMGIDAEDGSPVSAHGPVSVYSDVVQNGVLNNVSNGGSGILVIGGGKAATDHVTFFWNTIGSATGEPVTHVNSAAAIGTQSFAGFKMIAVASSQFETGSGGLTALESTALNGRSLDIADFVNAGGGLFGLTQAGLADPYGYLGVIGTFGVTTNQLYDDITPTAAGAAVGITDALDVFAWHDYYDTFPSFLNSLAVDAFNGRVAAIGGADVVLPGAITLDPATATNPVGTDHTVTATVRDSAGAVIPGVLVGFEVISGPNTGETGSDTTDVNGEATFTYTGSGGVGTDTIEASFLDATGTTRTATAEKTWEGTAAQATINIIKRVDSQPDGVFDDDASGWTFDVTQSSVAIGSEVTPADGEVSFLVDAGDDYAVVESAGPTGMWFVSWSCADDDTAVTLAMGSGLVSSGQGPAGLSLAPDQSITCSFDNQLLAGFMTGGGQLTDDNDGDLKKKDHEWLSFGGNVGIRLDGTLHGQWQANLHNVSDDLFDKGNFHSTSIDSVVFQNIDALEGAAPPEALYNFIEFSATGRFNGEDGWSVTVRATDTGEPGNGNNAGADTDSLRVRLFNPSGVEVYDSQTDFPAQQEDRHELDNGNIQIHPAE